MILAMVAVNKCSRIEKGQKDQAPNVDHEKVLMKKRRKTYILIITDVSVCLVVAPPLQVVYKDISDDAGMTKSHDGAVLPDRDYPYSDQARLPHRLDDIATSL